MKLPKPIILIYKHLTSFVVIGLLSGCTSALYKEQKSICSTQGFSNFPPNITYEMRTVPVSKSRQVPNPMYQPRYKCSTTYSGYGSSSSTCQQSYSYVPQYNTEHYTEYENRMIPVDWNKNEREIYIKQCIVDKCHLITGNERCKQSPR